MWSCHLTGKKNYEDKVDCLLVECLVIQQVPLCNHIEINVVSRHPSVVRNKLGQTSESPGSMDRHPAGTIFAKGYLLRRYTEEHDPGDEQCSL